MQYIEVIFTFDQDQYQGDIVLAEIAEIPFESFSEEEGKILAYIQKEDFNQGELDGLLWLKENEVSYTLKEIDDINWNEEWEKNFEPIVVNEECIVRATFHNLDKTYKYDLLIDPKMSFGTGHHATTYLMLNEMFAYDFQEKTVLDMGTGTGVLAILAAKLGSKDILAIDNDEWAFDNAKENLRLNECGSQIEIQIGDSKLISNKRFDFILANINRNVILNDLPLYGETLEQGGTLLISGIMTHDVKFVEEKAKQIGLILGKIEEKDNWNLFTFTKL